MFGITFLSAGRHICSVIPLKSTFGKNEPRMQSAFKPPANLTDLNFPSSFEEPFTANIKMAANPVSDHTHYQSPRHGEQSSARRPSKDEELCCRCQKWDLTDLYRKATSPFLQGLGGHATICTLRYLHENCPLCRFFAISYRYKFSEVVRVSAAPQFTFTLRRGAHQELSRTLTPHHHLDKVARSSGNVLYLLTNDVIGENGCITMSLEESGDATGPGSDDWGRQPCHVSWLARCMRLCAEEHKDCHADPAHQFDVPVYFIHYDNRRLCEAAPDISYTALSYVRGKERPDDGALDLDYFTALPALLPLTVENAITLTRQLGIRYLWVDLYCITKSEEDSTLRHDQLRTMD